MGIPVSTWATMARADSSAKRRGGTTNVLLAATKGRLRNSPGPPRATSNMSTVSYTCSRSNHEVPMGLVVPTMAA